MKLRQLEYVLEVVRNGLNVTAAAEKLYTSQPGVSSQIKRLEEELGLAIFERSGKHISGLTNAGKALLGRIERVLNEVENIKKIAADHSDPDAGSLTIATTHTQARYVLPDIVSKFTAMHPNVSLHIHQGTPTQIAEMTSSGAADIGIATEALELFRDLCLLPCYRWNRCVMVPRGHPLVSEDLLTLEAIARFPIITYVFGVADRSVINRAFTDVGLDIRVVLTAADAEVIKTYVRTGLGIGIVARMAYDKRQDRDLQVLDAGNLFDASVTSLAMRKNSVLRSYIFDFIELFAPHLNRATVDQVLSTNDKSLQQTLYDEHVAESLMR